MHKQTIGFIGLGQMGGSMALNLANAPVSLHVHDISPEAMQSAVAAGATGASNPAGIATHANLIFLCLPDAEQVEDVIFSNHGLIHAARNDLVVIDTSTLNHGAAIDIARRAADAGVSYSDCPISGLPQRAANGTLTMMFGGTDAAFAMAKPYLDVMGEFIIHCGPIGSGQMMKAVNNIIYDVNIAALCEVLPLAVRAGLQPEQLRDVVTNGSSRSFAGEHFVPRMLERHFEADFPMQAAYKDIQNIQEIADRLQAQTPIVNAMTSTYQAAIAAGFGAEPKSAMIKVYENALGTRFARAASRSD